jgi:hypothetical protein
MLVTLACPALAACFGAPVAQVGTISGDPEKDTFGLICERADVERTGPIASSLRRDIWQIGTSMGEAEKDTLGYLQSASAQ